MFSKYYRETLSETNELQIRVSVSGRILRDAKVLRGSAYKKTAPEFPYKRYIDFMASRTT